MTRALLLLLATLTLLASGPVHDGMHHEDQGPQQEGVELHGEDCQHFDGESSHDDECSLCTVSRVALDIIGASPTTVARAEPTRPVFRQASASPTSWSKRAHGARAPPANG
jgi:hypothetical protein